MKHWLMLGVGWGIILSSNSPRVRLLVFRLGQRYPKFRRLLDATKRQAAHLRRCVRWQARAS